MTKEQLIKLLQEDKTPMNTPIQIYLDCTNDDKGVLSISVDELRYSIGFESLMIYGTYEEDMY